MVMQPQNTAASRAEMISVPLRQLFQQRHSPWCALSGASVLRERVFVFPSRVCKAVSMCIYSSEQVEVNSTKGNS